MRSDSIAVVAGYLNRVSAAFEAKSDSELLASYSERRDEAAFAVLVHRHGPMVLGVCRRALGHSGDSDDAFQATFLELSKNAHRINSSLPGWLYRVAVRTTKKMVRKRRTETELLEVAEKTDPFATVEWIEVRRVLDEELSRLPATFQSPLILCYLEGLSRDEAAKRMGCSLRTLHRRLDAGRVKLRDRLQKRGLASALLATLVVEGNLRAEVPAQLAGRAVSLAVRGVGIPSQTQSLISGNPKGAMAMKATVFVGVAVSVLAVLLADRRPVGADPVPRAIPSTSPARAPLKKERPDDPMAKKIQESKDKAIKFLRENQKEFRKGEWSWEDPALNVLQPGGASSLALLALLENGVKVDDEVVVRGLSHLRTLKPQHTYAVGLQTLALCRANRKQDAKLIETNVKWLEMAAIWNAGNLIGWSYTENGGGRADNSNTRYAVAALYAAHRAGFKVKKDGFWHEVRGLYVRTQRADGGWSYIPDNIPGTKPSHTMTVSALLCLTLADEIIDKKDRASTAAIDAGLGWLAKEFRLVQTAHTLYNFDVVAAFGLASDLKSLGDKDKKHEWYKLGCEWLIRNQKASGEWRLDGGADSMPIISTSFALRFLASSPE